MIEYFIFFAGGLSLLFSIGQLLIRAKRLANYNLALMFLCLGVFILQLGLVVQGTAFARHFAREPVRYFYNARYPRSDFR